MASVKKIQMFEIMNECERLDIYKIMKWLDGVNCKYLVVKHDMDLPRAPHFHCFVKFDKDSARTIPDIAKQCGVQANWIEQVHKWKSALAYAFHLTDNAKDDGKYEYNESAIIGSRDIDINGIFKLSKEYQEAKTHQREIEELLYQYGNCEITKDEVLKRLSPMDYNKNNLLFKRMQEYRIMKVRNRNMTVIYLTGARSGCGKTTLAKYFARIMNYDFFISGSGKDVLDGYDKEECIILDDLRADAFTKAELFKLTDNNTNSSVKSRYKNKDISYCKLMIITSIKTPHDLYNWSTSSQEDKDESFTQFARRLGHKFYYIDNSSAILECMYDLDSDKVCKKTPLPFSMSQVFGLLGIEAKLGPTLMDEIFAKVKEDCDKKQEEWDKELPF